MNAIDYHSQTANRFDEHYSSSLFEERIGVWKSLLNKFANSGDCMLDAGCGSGVLSFIAAELGCKVRGVDGSPEMVTLCREKQKINKIQSASFSVETLPLKNGATTGPFDIIISSSVLEYVEEWSLCIEGLCSRLRPNGILIISIPNRASLFRRLERVSSAIFGRPRYFKYVKNIVTDTELQKTLETAGLNKIEHHYFSSSNTIEKTIKQLPLADKYSNGMLVGVYTKR